MDWTALFDLTWWTTARLGAAASVATAVIALAAAFAALSQLHLAVRASEERSRPIVTAGLRRLPHNKGYLNLVIRNEGAGLARDLNVTFNPALHQKETTTEGDPSVIPYIRRRYAQPIALLAPGEELNNLYYLPTNTHGGPHKNQEDVPNRFNVSVSYGPNLSRRTWWWPWSRPAGPYTDTFTLDTSLHMMETKVSSSTAPEAQLAEAVRTLKRLQESTSYVAGSLTDIAELGIRYRSRRADRERAEMRKRQLRARVEKHNNLADRVLARRKNKAG